MRVGELLEICAAGCLIAGIELYVGTWAALLVAGGCLTYLAQSYSSHPIDLAPASRYVRAYVRRKRRRQSDDST